MRHSLDTYELYASESFLSYTAKTKVRMKEKVDIDVLTHAVNIAIKRYPYFAVEVSIADDNSYELIPNSREVVVIPTRKKLPNVGSKEVNHHLLFIDVEDKDIYFNISHSLCGGKGFLPWVMTSVYQYVVEKYHVDPIAPNIRKPNSELLPTEAEYPNVDMLTNDEPILEYKQNKKPAILIWDYLNGLFNPFKRRPIYYQLSFNQSDIISFSKNNDSSVTAFFLIVMAKALDKVLPKRIKVIGGDTAHNPREDINMPYCHSDMLTRFHINYERKHLKKDMMTLGTVTRSQIYFQIDPAISKESLRKMLLINEAIDQVPTLKKKKAYFRKYNVRTGKGSNGHGTYTVHYTGKEEWGEVGNYIESYVIIVEGHALIEITSMENKIFASLMQLVKNTKYIKALGDVLNELGISYQLEGPYPKNMVKHELPKR